MQHVVHLGEGFGLVLTLTDLEALLCFEQNIEVAVTANMLSETSWRGLLLVSCKLHSASKHPAKIQPDTCRQPLVASMAAIIASRR